MKKKLFEDFKSDFNTLLNNPWSGDVEKKIVKILFKNKINIQNNEEKGKEFITQLFNQNKTLIQNNCSDKFVELINLVSQNNDSDLSMDDLGGDDAELEKELSDEPSDESLGDDSMLDAEQDKSSEDEQNPAAMGESVIYEIEKLMKEVTANFTHNKKLHYLKINKSSQINKENPIKENKMYKYFKIQFLNEAKYVAIPLFAVNAKTEHSDVLNFAYESKQIKTQKGVDYVIEVSQKEYEECVPDIEGNYGAAPKAPKPQDASIDASANQFDKIKQEKGAQQLDPKKLEEALSFLNESDEDDIMGSDNTKHMTFHESITTSDYISIPELINIANAAGESVIDAKEELLDLGAAYDGDVPVNEVKSILSNYDLLDLLEPDFQSPEDKQYGEDMDAEEDAFYREQGLIEASYAEDEATGRQHFAEFEEVDPIYEDPEEEEDFSNANPESGPMEYDGEPDFDEIDGEDYLDQYNPFKDSDLNEYTSSELAARGRRKIMDSETIEDEGSETLNEENDENTWYGVGDPEEELKENFIFQPKIRGWEGNISESNSNCPRCKKGGAYKIAGGYNECPNCHNHWKAIEENDTSDMSVPLQPAFGGDRKRLEDLSPYGKDNDSEYIEDNKVLKEKLVKFILKNCQGAEKFLKEGKFKLQAFLNSKSYGFVNLLECEFKKSLTEEENPQTLEITDAYFSGDEMVILYASPSEEDGVLKVSKEEFEKFLETVDPNWENYVESKYVEDETEGEDTSRTHTFHDTERYWNDLSIDGQNKLALEFLKSKGIS